MLALCTVSCCCLCNVCFRSSHACHVCSVVFLPVYSLFKCFRTSHACHLCSILLLPVQSLLMHVFQKLSYLLCGFCLSLSSLALPHSKAFQHFMAFSGSPTAVHRAFLFFHEKAWSQSQTDLFMCTLWACLSQTHRPIALHCMHYGITLWAYLSEPLSHKSLSLMENHNTVCSKLHDCTLLLCKCYGEVYGNITREENG